MHLVGAEYLVEEFLGVFGGAKHDDFRYGEFEVGFHVCGHGLVHVEHGGEFSLVAVARVEGVEHNLVANLAALEFGCFVGVLEECGAYDGVEHLDGVFCFVYSAVGVEFHHHAFYEGLVFEFFAGLLRAEAFAHHLVLFGAHFVGHLDGVVGEGDVFVDFKVEFGGEANFVGEGVCFVGIGEFLHVEGKGLAEDVEFVVLDIFEYFAVNNVVDNVGFYLLAEATAKLVHRHVTLAEAGDYVGCCDFFEFFLYGFGVVGGLNVNDDFAGDIGSLVKSYVHIY